MFVVMGGTGHVGAAVAETLLKQGKPVTVITRDAARARGLVAQGADVATASAGDVSSLRAALQHGSRAFLLNPPADVATDTDAVERSTVRDILAALDGSGLEKVVAASTGGAQRGERLGDLSVLWEFEQGLKRQPIPAAINRGAYYMSNWAAQLDAVRETGRLTSLLDAELAIPMVAPADLGVIAAGRLTSDVGDVDIQHIEGPAKYTAADVARAFAHALGRQVEVVVVPRKAWKPTFRSMGFSDAAADAYTRMTEVSVDSGFELGPNTLKGQTTLEDYVANLVRTAAPST